MQIQNYFSAKEELLQLAEKNLSSTKQARSVANILIDLIEKFPTLAQDDESARSLCNLTEKLFAFKEDLSSDSRSKIVNLFWSIHHLSSTAVKNLSEKKGTAENLINQYKDYEALLPDDQQYPVPLSILKGEKLPCSSYFKPLSVILSDQQATISRGLLAHYSEMVQAMLRNEGEEPQDTLQLMQLNKHQFDTLIAFLETSEKSLITQENAAPLMFAATYLQIPELIEECAIYLYQFLDDESALNLLNTNPRYPKKNRIIYEVEEYLSKKIKEGLSKTPPSSKVIKLIQHLKEHLIFPIRISLAGSNVTEEALKELVDFPLQELDISSCPNLSGESLSTIAKIKSLKMLSLNGNDWVDDASLKKIPKQIETLLLTNCKQFTKEGLKHLTNIRKLELAGCNQLRDEDFIALPKTLSELDVSFCKGVSQKAMSRIGEMKHLEKINLSQIVGLNKHLHLLPKSIISLTAAGTGFDDEALLSLSSLKHLEEAYLGNCPITDQGLAHLPESISLLSLNQCTKLTNAGALGLAKRKSLQTVFLRRCPKITKEGLKGFDDSVTVGWDAPQESRSARHQ